MNRIAIAAVLAAGFVLATAAGCASTSSIDSTVVRAPLISFFGHPEVHAQFNTACTWRTIGPEEGVENTGSCTATYAENLPRQIEAAATTTLRRGKFRVGHRGTPLVGHLSVTAGTQVLLTTLTDTKRNNTCAKLCGRPSCLRPSPLGALRVRATFVGPRGLAPGRDTVERDITFTAPLLARVDPVCSRADARRWHEMKRYNWGAAIESTVGWYRDAFATILLPHKEQFDLEFFPMEIPEGARGLAAAEQRRWDAALLDFGQALALAQDERADEQVPRIRHNIGVALMELGRLDEALEHAQRAHELSKASASQDLIKEIMRRISDRAKTT